jgi:uncharacterized protein YoxC
MSAEIARDEFEARVGVLEREVEGEKLVTRHILEQTRRNGDDLAAIKSRLDRVENKVEHIGQDLNSLRQDVTSLRGTVHGLASNLPNIVGQAVREVMQERDRKD